MSRDHACTAQRDLLALVHACVALRCSSRKQPAHQNPSGSPSKAHLPGAAGSLYPLDTAKRCLLLTQKHGTRQHGWARALAGRRRIFSDESALPQPLVETQTTPRTPMPAPKTPMPPHPSTPKLIGGAHALTSAHLRSPAPTGSTALPAAARPQNVEISRCRCRVPASSLTLDGIHECT